MNPLRVIGLTLAFCASAILGCALTTLTIRWLR